MRRLPAAPPLPGGTHDVSHPLVKVDPLVLRRVRTICLRWPDAAEEIKWGRPHFLAGKKLFASVGPNYARPSVSMKVTPLLQAELVERAEWVLTPYAAHQGWVTRYTDVPVDWSEIEEYLRVGYRLVALPRMLAAMDVGAAPAKPPRRQSGR
jgi:predicted DNA-binding protein (MmcQ/YjbR family)